jgi:hypothetical protein
VMGYCQLLEHLCNYPSDIHFIPDTLLGDFPLGFSSNDIHGRAKETQKFLNMHRQMSRRKKQSCGVHYLVGYQGFHFAAIVAFVSTKKIVVMDGYFPAPQHWEFFVFMLLYYIHDNNHKLHELNIVFSTERVSVQLCRERNAEIDQAPFRVPSRPRNGQSTQPVMRGYRRKAILTLVVSSVVTTLQQLFTMTTCTKFL